MKCSVNWLSDFVSITLSAQDLAAALTMSGSKAETVEVLGGDIQNVVVGKLLSVERHPNADKLLLCKVDVGGDEILQVLTGAPNVSQGDIVPVALDGALLPGGKVIRTGKMRGELSQGMLCSIGELNLTLADEPGADAEGILLLPGCDAPLGQDIREALLLSDSAIDFEITNNRPDCLSVIGLARETAATLQQALTLRVPGVRGGGQRVDALLSVEVPDADLCPRYSARMVENVRVEPSPRWLRRRLRASGIRPINNIVDITNYVLLEYGQPMHAFDFGCVEGGKIVVRRAKEGEELETLDGQTRALSPDMLVIADARKPVGVAGVMGGEGSGITESTTTIVFESANFSGPSIRKTALSLAMRTDASTRFEKGLDASVTVEALQRACELVELLGAGTVCEGVIDLDQSDLRTRRIPFGAAKINAFLGTDIPEVFMERALASVGCVVRPDGVTPPSWRADLNIWEDLAEEVARLYGYNNIASTITASSEVGRRTPLQVARRGVSRTCIALGYREMLTYSFVGRSLYAKAGLSAEGAVTLLNPLGEETSVMRTEALPSLLEALSRNQAARNPAASLFEQAMVYLPRPKQLPEETLRLVLGLYGEGVDFFSLKGDVEAVLSAARVASPRFESTAKHAAFHPGRCAELRSGDRVLGVLGEIHPAVLDRFGCDKPVFAAELSLPALLECALPEAQFAPLPRFPQINRDLAVVCDAALPASALTDAVWQSASKMLTGCAVFDVYTGAPIPSGQKSVALSLTFRADDRTLTDAEADASVAKALKALEAQCGAVLRS